VRVITDPAIMAEELDRERADGRTIGLVPTMGALHAGHASLIQRAAAERNAIVVSVFVNPLQFGPHEDFDRYPRRLEADTAIAQAAGAAYVFAPSEADMYPSGFGTIVHVRGITERLEGTARPGHFDGVATVVTKLFAIAGRCHAYFGEKDFQQLQVVRQLVRDLLLPAQIVACPTVREPDGLALSSRNAYLTPKERESAPVLYRALRDGVDAFRSGKCGPSEVRAVMERRVSSEPLVDLEYAELVDANTLSTPVDLSLPLRVVIAARFRETGTRLIDNLAV
jgi:pantoate--beta-alanine ligase